MSLLDKEIERKLVSESGKKIRFVFHGGSIDSVLLKTVGRYLGTTTPGATVKEAFLFAATLSIKPQHNLLATVKFDHVRCLFDLVERRAAASEGPSTNNLIGIMVLRWHLLLLAEEIFGMAATEIKSTEQVAEAVLRLCQQKLVSLFSLTGS